MNASASSTSRWRRGRVRLGLTIVTGAIAVLAVIWSTLAFRYQQEMVAASRYNVTFDLSQTATELLRFQLSLGESIEGDRNAQLRLRWSILENRIAVIGDSRLLKEGEGQVVFGDLKEALADVPALLLEDAPRQAKLDLLERLKPFAGRVLRLTSQSHSRTGDEVMRNQDELTRFFAGICAITLVLVAFGAVLVGYILRQNRHLDRVVRTDSLTGLANRFAFNAALDDPAHDARAMLLVDVDHFKALNDTCGHEVGDSILAQLARRLETATAGFHACATARIGGDEFAVLFYGAMAEINSQRAGDKILEAMADPFTVDGRQVKAGVTLGISARPGKGRASGVDLLHDADIALSCAKGAGRGTCSLFHPDMKRDFLRHQRLLDDLRLAVARSELRVDYQPIVDLASGRTQGFEALLRWDHPALGPVSPAEFIPIAEKSGQIAAIGAWVIEEACREAAGWPAGVFVAVNVSARQLTDLALVGQVQAAARRNGLEPFRVEIEITESTLIENDETALRVLHALKALGCRIALDDFGTGYASLSYLRRFPFDKLKIDQSFLNGESEEEERIAIISAIASLARQLGLHIVAEGVETDYHSRLVRQTGCGSGQGYFFGRPMTARDCRTRLSRERWPEPANARSPCLAAGSEAISA